MARAIEGWNKYGTPPGRSRTPAELTRLFDGLILVEPGVVSATRWRPEAVLKEAVEEVDLFVGLGRKP
jgi:hypothetical protein